MGLFYAYVIDTNDTYNYRWIITFRSRAVADEWWRSIDDDSTKNKTELKRLSPQLYKSNAQKGQFYTNIVAPEDRLFVTALPALGNYALTLVPPHVITDHISGGTYFIRSQSCPDIYWCVKKDNLVYASSSPIERTKFKISIKGKDKKGKVMIDSDDIEITNAFGTLKVKTNDDNILTVGKQAGSYKFGDFTGGFLIERAEGPEKCCDNPESNSICKTEDGEIWELTT